MEKKRRANPTTSGAPDKSRAEKMFITPLLARLWLKRNTDNRPWSNGHSTKISIAIQLGYWDINGATIKFDDNDVLRDGQTRLHAIIEADIGVWSWVIFDVQSGKKAFDSIDQGRIRTLGHLLAIRRYKNYNHLAAAIRLVYALHEDIVSQRGAWSTRVGLEIIEEHPELVDCVESAFTSGMHNVWTISMAGGLYYLMRLKDQALADKYWESLSNGVITSKTNPTRLVRDTMLRNKHARKDQQYTPTTMQAIAIKGWNLLRTGKTRKQIKWNPETEAFPVIE